MDSNDKVKINEGEDNTITRGNTELEPYVADKVNLTGTYVFPEKLGRVELTYFYADVKSYKVKRTEQDIPWRNDSGDYYRDALTGDPLLFDVEQTWNDEGGFTRGAELAYDQSFSFLPGYWSGFGWQMNYTYNETRKGEIREAYNFIPYYQMGDNTQAGL